MGGLIAEVEDIMGMEDREEEVAKRVTHNLAGRLSVAARVEDEDASPSTNIYMSFLVNVPRKKRSKRGRRNHTSPSANTNISFWENIPTKKRSKRAHRKHPSPSPSRLEFLP